MLEDIPPGVHLRDFLEDLVTKTKGHPAPLPEPELWRSIIDFPLMGCPITIDRFAAQLNEFLTPEIQVVADTGDCLFAAIELRVHERSEFLALAFYTTMGLPIPAALGA